MLLTHSGGETADAVAPRDGDADLSRDAVSCTGENSSRESRCFKIGRIAEDGLSGSRKVVRPPDDD